MRCRKKHNGWKSRPGRKLPPSCGGLWRSSSIRRPQRDGTEEQRKIEISKKELLLEPCQESKCGFQQELFYRIGNFVSIRQKSSARMRTRRKGRWLPRQPRLARECAKAHSFLFMTKKCSQSVHSIVFGMRCKRVSLHFHHRQGTLSAALPSEDGAAAADCVWTEVCAAFN